MATTRRGQENQRVNSSSNRWQIIYCSFALILVVFFVMILSNSVVSEQSVVIVQQQFSRDNASQASGFPSSSSFEEQDVPVTALRDAAKQLQVDQITTLKMTSTGIDVILPKHLFFFADRNEMEAQISPYLNVIGDVIAKNGFSLHIRVYDTLLREKENDTPESKQMSWRQSAYRAVNIMQYFLAYGRLSPDQVTASGFVSRESPPGGSNIFSQGRVELHLAVKDNQ